MCGIVGLYHRDRGRAVSADALRTMCDAIVHRGPDDEGYHVDANVGMGMRRLSIIDREGGHQPVFNEDRQVSVVFNGEIYNHKDLRSELEGLGHRFRTRSDTEVLVHGYEQWGIDLPKRLNGMFAFSIWDRPNRRAMIARDHLGIKPLYVYRDTDRFAWASEIKALLTLPGIERNVNHAAVLDFLRYGYVPAPRTMFEGISKVEPGTVTVLEGDQVRTTSYWALRFPDAVNRSEDSWCEEIRELVDDSVQRQLMSDVPLGAFLSGGVDSSAIVATMSRLGVNRISTYAIGFGGEDAFHNELDKAQIIARQFNTDHHEIVVEPDVAELMPSLIRHLDEPFTDTSFIVTYLVSKLARESVTVILSGVGGDEIFAGYRRYLGPRLQNIYQWVPSVLRRRMIAPVLGRLPIDRGSAMKAVFRYARGFSEQSEFPEPLRYQGYVSVCNGERSELLMPEMAELDERFRSEQVADFYSTAECDDALNRMMYADIKSSLVRQNVTTP